MPLYEYLCETCGQQHESYKRLTEEKKDERCPACGGRSVKMGISLFTRRVRRPREAPPADRPARSPFG